VFPVVALPYILIHRPAEIDRNAKSIAEDIDSEVQGRISAAAQAIRHWAHLAAIHHFPDLPPNLLPLLFERVIFRRKADIKSCLFHLAALISELPETLSSSQGALLSTSLIPWHDATILAIADEEAGDFGAAERPQVSVQLAYLAAALRNWYANQSPDTPEPRAIAKWQTWCEADRLPEIRRAFDAWNEIMS
jgi:hypothetical protein